MDSRQDLTKCIEDWQQSVTDRIDNLCAIYKCADIRTATNIVMTTESAIMALFKSMCMYADTTDNDDVEMVEMLSDCSKHALQSVVCWVVDLLCVDESRKAALINDIMSIVKTRVDLERTLNSSSFDSPDD